MGLPPAPDHHGAHLRQVMTSAAAATGLEGFQNRLGVPRASIVVVVLTDGLGDEQLAAHTGHARFLASAWRRGGGARVLDTGAPTTTAASLASLGTGLSPGEHGLVGYDVLSPELGRVVNMLGRWDEEVEPRTWQPHPTVFERATDAGAQTLTVSRTQFRDSQLTQAVLAGSEFTGAQSIEARFAAAADWISARRPGAGGIQRGPAGSLLIYLYVDELDKTGHSTGVGSQKWITMLETLDSAARRFCEDLSRRYGDQATVLLTADHGMVNVVPENRVDLSEQPELLDGLRHTAGEPRFLHLHTQDGATEDVLAAWRSAYGEQAWVLTGDDAIASGWFGPVQERVRGRIGDVLVAVHEDIALFHTARTGTAPMEMVGQHGSLTRAERRVPLLELTGRDFSVADHRSR